MIQLTIKVHLAMLERKDKIFEWKKEGIGSAILPQCRGIRLKISLSNFPSYSPPCLHGDR